MVGGLWDGCAIRKRERERGRERERESRREDVNKAKGVSTEGVSK